MTREALLRVARRLFVERGFAAASTEEIVQQAGMTRGALYHQFRDKQDLFRAVYEQVEAEFREHLIERMRARAPAGSDPWREVREGAQAFLDVAVDPEIQRIIFIDALWVLGRRAGRQVAQFGLDLIRRGLLRSMEKRQLEPQPIDPLAHVLRAAITEGAMYIARAEDRATAREEVGGAIDRLIDGLLVNHRVTRPLEVGSASTRTS